MSTVTVTPGQSIQAAIDTANPGDTIDVQAGSYNDQFLTIEKSLTIEAIGGPAIIAATVNAPDGKAIITEGQPGLTVNISGFDISGAVVGDNNGAAIRYEGGTLNLSNVSLHNNQEGTPGCRRPERRDQHRPQRDRSEWRRQRINPQSLHRCHRQLRPY